MVINAAAYTNVDKAEEDSKTAYAINALAVGELAKACREQNIPLTFQQIMFLTVLKKPPI